jgi:hypothetical protein
LSNLTIEHTFKVAINLPFIQLSQWQQIAFSAALLERMLPNYQMFSEVSDFGNVKVLRNQLDIIWQWLSQPNTTKINIDAQLVKLESETPNPDEYDSFGVFPALDTCMTLAALWQLMQSRPQKKNKNIAAELDDIKSISRLSLNSVSYYVELLLLEELKENETVTLISIDAHPLTQWEKDTQQELMTFLQFAAENKKSCDMAKKISLAEGLSSLGIEIV